MRGIFGIPKAASPIFSDPPSIDPTSLSQPFLAAEHTHGFPHGTGFQILLMKKTCSNKCNSGGRPPSELSPLPLRFVSPLTRALKSLKYDFPTFVKVRPRW